MPTQEDDDEYLALDGYEFFYEMQGRKFNTMNPTYMLPADNEEIQRFTLFHRLVKWVFCGNSFPGLVQETLESGEHHVLDVGTGRGDWAVELCDMFPSVHVTGVDLVPIQYQEVPPKCLFEIWDANAHDLPYGDRHFDLVHARAVHTGILDYPRFLCQVGRILRPGGLILLIEPDLRQWANNKPELKFKQGAGPRGWFTFWETYRSCLFAIGIDVTVPQRLKKLLEETNMFEQIEELEGEIPVGFYPIKRALLTVGQLQWMAYDLLLPALKPMFLSVGLPEASVDQIVKDAQHDLYYTKFKLSSRLRIAHARRRPN
ncbi:S-adenosyl-L-methionine-dependent methyltransferase [Mycena alexandri]|uniref:S-adenosyl-L-methionine-dependent methyltransferase n=1 Tax=Mycena alexandri TaxID=1745969 RepID=A0AAD6XEA6_9AGAR|nr:S-adenosyl-L-methionine-dependent methyltransferase [Mycena alexandri]